MKELSIEEKAKRYDETLERAKECHIDGLYLHPSVKDVIEHIFPELAESEDEKIRKEMITYLSTVEDKELIPYESWVAWLEKQGEQKPTRETEPFEAKHGKYYYCIKDYFFGGKKQASKGDVVQALRGLPIMSLKDASEYFLPVNFIKCNSVWSKEDRIHLTNAIIAAEKEWGSESCTSKWLKSLKDRVGNFDDGYKVGFSAAKYNQWKPSEEQLKSLKKVIDAGYYTSYPNSLETLYEQLKQF